MNTKFIELEHSHAHRIDGLIHANHGRMGCALSPASIVSAYWDWWLHLSISPGKQQELLEKAKRKLNRFWLYAFHILNGVCEPCIDPLPQDKRFAHADWQRWPFNLFYQAFLLNQQWWWNASTDVRGVTRHHEEMVTFLTRQWLDVFSPSNYLWANPEVLGKTVQTRGGNLFQGAVNSWKDWARLAANKQPEGSEAYQVGKNIAITPGKVIFRNRLIELIQFTAQTQDVYPEPVLIVPSWIMKYYILDLSPHNSLARYLVEQGYTVYMISWKNPDTDDRDLGMDDYLQRGIFAAIDVLWHLQPNKKIHAVGYCLGGTMLAVAAAMMAREDDTRLHSLTLLASQLDFEEPGELSLFIDESQIAYLEDIMWDQGYLDGKQMAGAFTLLNSKDLVWSKMVHDYLMGARRPVTDLMAWNADATRMPYRMHSEYLRSLYLNNDLAEGRYKVDDRPVVLADIRLPMFVLGTIGDHVSPWRSVYKVHLLIETEITFVLVSGGHNAGIVSPPVSDVPKRSYQLTTHGRTARYSDPDTWQAHTPKNSGSWWPTWLAWLKERSHQRVAPPQSDMNYPVLSDAPGEYVLLS